MGGFSTTGRIVRARRAWGATILAASLWSGVALADGPDLLGNPYSLSLGTYLLDTDTTLSLDASSDRTGTEFNWESVLGGGEVNRFRIDGTWRFAERHKLRGMWFDFSRKRTRAIDTEIDWGDEVFPVDSEVTGSNRFSIFELAYEYAFMRRDDFELAVTAGLHYTQFKATLSATLPSGGSTTREASDTAKLDVPLPVFGLRGLWNVTGDFWLDAGAQYFSLSYDDYDGSITDLRVSLLWQPKDWVGIGIGYNRFGVDVELERDSFRGEFDWTYDGPLVFYNVSF
jgi:hypothetical protein